MFKENKTWRSKKGFRELLPPSVVSSLPSEAMEAIYQFEYAIRDDMFRFEGARMGFFLLCALDEDKFKGLVLDALKSDSDMSFKRFGKSWKHFLRVLFVHAVAPEQCAPVPKPTCDKFTGSNTSVVRYLMYESGWILTTGWKNHFRIAPKGAKLVEECIKMCEREYSEYLVGQLQLKAEKMGNLNDE